MEVWKQLKSLNLPSPFLMWVGISRGELSGNDDGWEPDGQILTFWCALSTVQMCFWSVFAGSQALGNYSNLQWTVLAAPLEIKYRIWHLQGVKLGLGRQHVPHPLFLTTAGGCRWGQVVGLEDLVSMGISQLIWERGVLLLPCNASVGSCTWQV